MSASGIFFKKDVLFKCEGRTRPEPLCSAFFFIESYFKIDWAFMGILWTENLIISLDNSEQTCYTSDVGSLSDGDRG